MFVHEAGSIVDLVVDDHVDIFLGVVLGNFSVCEFLRHVE